MLLFTITIFISTGLITNQSLAYTIVNAKINISLNYAVNTGDSKLIILIDSPKGGGKAIKYDIFEISSTSTFWIYERGLEQSNTGFCEPLINDMDFIIIVTSNSGGGLPDEFRLTITVYDDSATSSSDTEYYKYDNTGTLIKAAIYQVQYAFGSSHVFQLSYSEPVAWLEGKGHAVYTNGYSESDWSGIWNYLTQYNGNEQIIENLVKYFDFPIIRYVYIPPGIT